MMDQVGRREGAERKGLGCYVQREFYDYWQSGEHPSAREWSGLVPRVPWGLPPANAYEIIRQSRA